MLSNWHQVALGDSIGLISKQVGTNFIFPQAIKTQSPSDSNWKVFTYLEGRLEKILFWGHMRGIFYFDPGR